SFAPAHVGGGLGVWAAGVDVHLQRAGPGQSARGGAADGALADVRLDLRPVLLGRLLPTDLAEPDLAPAGTARVLAADTPDGRCQRSDRPLHRGPGARPTHQRRGTNHWRAAG